MRSLYQGYENPLAGRPARPLPQRVAIIGAGTIGPDIGYYLKSALPELALLLLDIDEQALSAARERFGAYARKGLARGKLSEALAAQVCENIETSTDYAALGGCEWVIEAATENLDLKRRIFAQAEANVAADALITSNTSSLPAEWMFRGLRHPERCTVTHFFAPAWRNPIVEIVSWAGAAAAALEHLRWLFCHTGKVPLVTADAVCFMLDRIFDNWCNEAALLLESATAAQIDAIAGELVHAGPFFVLNMANGNPIITETNNLQADAEGEHYRPAAIFRSVERWHVGERGREPALPEVAGEAVRDRLRGILVSQSADILDRGIGAPADLDLGCRLALGFRRGPLELMREAGEAEVERVLERFCAERPGMPRPARPLADYQRFRRHVLVDALGDVRLLTLRRPEAMNALHEELTDEILAVIRELEDDPEVAGFVLAGYGPKAFCAGADIGRFPAMLGDAERAAEYARDCSRLLVHLDGMGKPVVAALNGMALGGGLELAMRCHALVAQRHAWLQFPEITLGIVPGIGAMVVPYRRWPQAAGVFHAMLCQARRLPAEEAQALGILDGLADDYASLVALAARRVRELAGAPPAPAEGPVSIPAPEPGPARDAAGEPLSGEVLAIMRRAITEAAAADSLAAALEVGYRAFGESALTAAAREGIGAFGERRRPDFTKTG